MNETLGTKQHCDECGAKFYDMDRFPVICPKCGYQFPEDDMEIVIEFDMDLDDGDENDDLDIEVEEDEEIEGMSGGVAELENLNDLEDEDMDHLREVEDHHEEPENDVNSDDAEDEMFLDELPENSIHIIDDPDEE